MSPSILAVISLAAGGFSFSAIIYGFSVFAVNKVPS